MSLPPEIAECLAGYAIEQVPARETERAAVKAALAKLQSVAPGYAVEVRIPPYSVVQAVPGPRHRRGTPPAVVEMPARLWLELAAGLIDWPAARASGRLHASGERSDLSEFLPLWFAAANQSGQDR